MADQQKKQDKAGDKPATNSGKAALVKTETVAVEEKSKEIGVTVQVQIPDGPAISSANNIEIDDIFNLQATLAPGTTTSLSIPPKNNLCFVLLKAD